MTTDRTPFGVRPPQRRRSGRVGDALRTALEARSTRARHRSRGGIPAPPGTADRALLLTLGLGGLALFLLALA